MQQYIVKIQGPDAKGIIFKTTKVLSENNCNIIKQEEYVSPNKLFFMRTIFDSENLNQAKLINDLNNALEGQLKIEIIEKRKKDIVILVTKEHHCLTELLSKNYFNELNANILAVIGNHSDLELFTKKFNIPFHYVSHENKSREEQEQEIKKLIDGYAPDYIVLAKYMRILSKDFIESYPQKIINIHHSFLPAFIGANPYKQAYERGVKIIGATAHFVTEILDEGPIIVQDVKKINHGYTAYQMSLEGREVEKSVLSKALRLVFDDKVFIYKNRTIIL